jgi:hypothetical protein
MDAEWTNDRDSVLRLGTQVRCPTLVIQDRRTRSWDLRAGLP